VPLNTILDHEPDAPAAHNRGNRSSSGWSRVVFSWTTLLNRFAPEYQGNFYVRNVLNRCAIALWMPLKFNADGSLDIYLRAESPGSDKEANWLPTPSGAFNVTIRNYRPKQPGISVTDFVGMYAHTRASNNQGRVPERGVADGGSHRRRWPLFKTCPAPSPWNSQPSLWASRTSTCLCQPHGSPGTFPQGDW
jgi:hypothetical protein